MSRLPVPGVEAAVLTRVPMRTTGVAVVGVAWLREVASTAPVSPGQQP